MTSKETSKIVNGTTSVKGNSSLTYRLFTNLTILSTLQMDATTTTPEILGQIYDSVPAAETTVHTTLSSTPFSSVNMSPSDNSDIKSSDESRTKLKIAPALHSKTHTTSPSTETALNITRLAADNALRSKIGSTTTSIGTTTSTGSSSTTGYSRTQLHSITSANYRISTAVNQFTTINIGLKDSLQSLKPSGSNVFFFDNPVVVAGMASAAGVVTVVPLIACIYKAFAKGATIAPK